MATLTELARRVNRIADGVDKEASKLKQMVALAIIEYLIKVTPVDTSKALSNWRVSAGYALGGWIEAHVVGSRGSTQGASMSKALGDARKAIAAAKPGQPLAIFNNVPYIVRLNEGSSTQAPAGFVEAAILIGRRVAREYSFKLRR